ncbi:MAG: C40 family peptidase [Saprospiraceae bacterium]|nr:C40 family peptidase [Saprospiraceae bacterium]
MRYLILLIILIPSYCCTQRVLSVAETKRYELLLKADKYIGLKYRSKVNKNVFDCSGYVKFLMAEIGKNVTRSSVSQIHDGKRVTNIKEARLGDIIVFKGRNKHNIRPGHVGLVHHWSQDTLYFIHSSVTKGIVIDNLFDPYYANRFLQIRDVIGN